MITLINGQSIDENRVTFNQGNYEFTYKDPSGVTYVVTEFIKQTDKKKFPGFDVQTDLIRIYNINTAAQTGHGAPVLNTSTADLFVENVKNSVTPPAIGLGIILLVGVGIYFYLESRKK